MYALYKHEPGKPPKLSVAGLKSARRDNAPMLKELFESVLYKRLVDADTPGSIMLVNEWLDKVKNNEFPMEMYHITTSIGRNYKNPNLLQPTLQKKIRQKGGICDSGTRVHYVVCKSGNKVAEKAESPLYAKLEDIDRVWYVKDHVQSCILELFDVFGDTKVEFVKKMFYNACKAIESQGKKQPQIAAFFKAKAKKRKA